MKTTFFTAVATATLVLSGAAHAENSETIKVSNFDLNKQSEVNRLYISIVGAAERVCAAEQKNTIKSIFQKRKDAKVCTREVVRSAVVATKSRSVSQTYRTLPRSTRYDLAKLQNSNVLLATR